MSTSMVHRILVIVAVACCGLVGSSYVLFARDQIAGASSHQVSELAPSAARGVPPVSAHHHQVAQPRRFIDGASHELTSPFDALVSSSPSEWARRSLLLLLALLVYGVGFGFLARYSRGTA